MASRPKRWAAAVAKLQDGLSELADLKEEYSEWKENLPESLQESPVGEKLSAIEDLDIDTLQGYVDDLDGADLPLGFGKD
jgi:hypothetical protein